MNMLHPLRRIEITAAIFALLGSAVLAVAEPASTTRPEPVVAVVGWPSQSRANVAEAPARRSWRALVPAVFLQRRIRAA